MTMPSCAPRPVPTSSAVGVARPSAQGHAMISTATDAVNAVSTAAPASSQPTRVAIGQHDHDRHEHRRDAIGKPLHVSLAGLRLFDQPDQLGESRVCANPGRAYDDPAACVDRGARDLVAGTDLDGHRLAGEHRRVNDRTPLDDDSVGRDLVPRSHDEQVVHDEGADRHPHLAAAARSVVQDGDVLRAEIEQGPHRCAGHDFRARLHEAAGEYEDGDGRGDLEVDLVLANALSRQQGHLHRRAGEPASPTNSAHRDQRYAALTPIEMSVSMVATPCRALVQAARWKGRAPHTTTGEASASAAHCQSSNCRGRTIETTRTGSARTAETMSRWRSAWVGASRGWSCTSTSRPGGTGSVAV